MCLCFDTRTILGRGLFQAVKVNSLSLNGSAGLIVAGCVRYHYTRRPVYRRYTCFEMRFPAAHEIPVLKTMYLDVAI